MTPMKSWPQVLQRPYAWLVLAGALLLALMTASVAFAMVDEFGGASWTAPYAPYTAGPVVPEQDSVPYAPYTAGPVVREQFNVPYAPYTAGPVVRELKLGQYAPYTAGPVVREEKASNTPMNIGHYLLK